MSANFNLNDFKFVMIHLFKFKFFFHVVQFLIPGCSVPDIKMLIIDFFCIN